MPFAQAQGVPPRLPHPAGDGGTPAVLTMGSSSLTARATNDYAPRLVEHLQGKAVTLIAMGEQHSAAVVGDQLLTWGSNTYGQLGLRLVLGGAAAAQDVPACVAALQGMRITHVAVGQYHSAAVADGQLYTWGLNTDGQLGLAFGDYTTFQTPAAVPDLRGKTVTALALGDKSTYALADGVLYSWGSNAYGELGHGTINRPFSHAYTVPTPVDFFGAPAAVVAVAAGGKSAAAVLANGTAYGWGYNAYGQLGVGYSSTRVVSPEPLLLDNVTAVAVSSGTHIVSLADGDVWLSGRNNWGQLGDGTSSGSVDTPRRVDALAGLNATAAAAGSDHSCAVAAGQVYCWGRNDKGQCGTGGTSPAQQTLPVAAGDLRAPVTGLALGSFHSAAISDGRVYSWGRGTSGQLGRESTPELPLPAQGLLSAGGAAAVAVGDTHAAAVVGGAVLTWGSNNHGQLGLGTFGGTLAAQNVTALAGREVSRIAVGSHHTAALVAGRLYIWGYNGYGQLGLGTTTTQNTPQAVPGLPYTVTAVATGQYFTVAVTQGEVWAWGYNQYGQLGLGHTTVCARATRQSDPSGRHAALLGP